MTISILDMPSEILLKIFMMVESDVSLHPFIHFSNRGILYSNNMRIYSFVQGYRGGPLRGLSSMYENYCLNNPICVLPSSLCILSRVCKEFQNEISTGDYWKTIYIRDFRKGKPYVHPKQVKFYKEKYYKIIKNYYNLAYYNIKLDIDCLEKNIIAKTNNSIIYLENIRHAVDSLLIDNKYKTILITGLKQVRKTILGPPPRYLIEYYMVDKVKNIPFDTIISYRRKCNNQIKQFKYQLDKFSNLFNKYKTITEKIYDIGKPLTGASVPGVGYIVF
jgi:hypothetical protein